MDVLCLKIEQHTGMVAGKTCEYFGDIGSNSEDGTVQAVLVPGRTCKQAGDVSSGSEDGTLVSNSVGKTYKYLGFFFFAQLQGYDFVGNIAG